MPFIRNVVMGIVGEMSKLFLAVATQLEVRGLDRLITAIEERPKGVPLLTVSNHTSTVDDPLIFGVLPTRILFNSEKMRWALGAAEITHRNALYRWFFSAGQVLPIRRGEGVLQPSMNDALCRPEVEIRYTRRPCGFFGIICDFAGSPACHSRQREVARFASGMGRKATGGRSLLRLLCPHYCVGRFFRPYAGE